ncbi:hypothetical protein EMIT0158MI4_30039 [Burkholderia ambifaria]
MILRYRTGRLIAGLVFRQGGLGKHMGRAFRPGISHAGEGGRVSGKGAEAGVGRPDGVPREGVSIGRNATYAEQIRSELRSPDSPRRGVPCLYQPPCRIACARSHRGTKSCTTRIAIPAWRRPPPRISRAIASRKPCCSRTTKATSPPCCRHRTRCDCRISGSRPAAISCSPGKWNCANCSRIATWARCRRCAWRTG